MIIVIVCDIINKGLQSPFRKYAGNNTYSKKVEEFVVHAASSVLFEIRNEICQRRQADRLKSGRVKADRAFTVEASRRSLLSSCFSFFHPSFSNPVEVWRNALTRFPYFDKSHELSYTATFKKILRAEMRILNPYWDE